MSGAVGPAEAVALGLLAPIAIGVALSALAQLLAAENRASVPLAVIVRRGALRTGAAGLLWVALAAVFHALLARIALRPAVPDTAASWLVAGSLGFLLPLSVPLNARVLTPRLARSSPRLARPLQLLGEIARIDPAAVIGREERRAAAALLDEGSGAASVAIDRLYEFHVLEIARSAGRATPPPDVPSLLGLARTGHRGLKAQLLLRHLGYRAFLAEVGQTQARPSRVLPSWPALPDRRRLGTERRSWDPTRGARRRELRRRPWGRRKLDAPQVRAFFLDRSGA